MEESKKIKAKELLVDCLREYAYMEDENGIFIFDVFASYDDGFSEKQICKILQRDDPDAAFYEAMDSIYDEFVYEERDRIVNDALKEAYPADRKEKKEIRDYLLDLFYEMTEFNLPYEHYLDQTVKADIMIDTGDSNYDYMLNSVYPSYHGEKGSGICGEASLVWLADSQGYSLRELEKELDKGDVLNPVGFMDSVRQEVANETSCMNCLTFLVRLPLKEMIKINKLMKKQRPYGEHIFNAYSRPDCGSIRIAKETVTGLYDPWTGAGSTFEIELEKDVELPIRFIRSCLPDSYFTWSVSSVYGMLGSAWREHAVHCIKEPEVA